MQREAESFDREFTAKDAGEIAGISYRQLSDWDAKGATGSKRESKSGWRRYGTRELFALMVCSDIRKRFGVPVDALKYVTSFMLQEGANHFEWAASVISKLGLAVYLLTDLSTTFIMESDLEFEFLIRQGYFRVQRHGSFLLVHMNPIVNRLLIALGEEPLETSEEAYIARRNASRVTIQFPENGLTSNERDLVRLLRAKADQRITVTVKDGNIVHAAIDEQIQPDADVDIDNQLASVLETQDFGTLTINKKGGKLVSMNRRTPIKFDRSAK